MTDRKGRGTGRSRSGGPSVVDLAEVRRTMGGLVGGKAANLGEMAAAGERVPPGFCVTTAAYRTGTVPADAITDAYVRMGEGPVAVRSSATAEDLPDASFAGQQDTYLNIEGADAVADAVQRCWASLDNERAVAYRDANGIPRSEVQMAVVVQRMVDAETAGVLFTADPVSGSRSTAVIDAARGLGTAVVDGATDTDHYTVTAGAPPEADGGCLTSAQLVEIAAAGRRLEEHFGAPQDAEWAYGGDGVLWLVQSRPITTLFPLPPQDLPDMPRLYLEVGSMQGMLRPFTPMGVSMMEAVWAGWAKSAVGVDTDTRDSFLMGIGNRLFIDISKMVRSPFTRGRMAEGLQVYGPRAISALQRVLEDPRFAPRKGSPLPVGAAISVAGRLIPAYAAGVGWALAKPAASREAAYRATDNLRTLAGPEGPRTPAERLDWIAGDATDFMLGGNLGTTIGPVFAGILAGTLPTQLLKGVATQDECATVLGGMPHNVTTEMNLALWRVAERAREHGALFAETPPADLAEQYRSGKLPDIGLAGFLDAYGHRTAGEVDVGVPRWRDDPTPVFGAIANYLKLDDPDQAPDRRFARAAAAAEAKLAELGARAVRERPVRGRIARFLMQRSRELTGMREYAKFAWLVPYAEIRRQLVLAGESLAAADVLDTAEDVMFLTLDDVRAAGEDGADRRALVAERRRAHARELRRGSVPSLLLSDGTDLAATAPRPPAPEHGFAGLPASPGFAEGRARVITDPSGAHVEPGEILVAPTTDPGWTPLFMTAAGLVSDTGSTVAHGPTVAREYGIPAVVAVPDATEQIRTGDLLRVDGTAGTVEVVSADSPAAEGAGNAAEAAP